MQDERALDEHCRLPSGEIDERLEFETTVPFTPESIPFRESRNGSSWFYEAGYGGVFRSCSAEGDGGSSTYLKLSSRVSAQINKIFESII